MSSHARSFTRYVQHATVVTRRASAARMTRLRSSSRCSQSVIFTSPSGEREGGGLVVGVEVEGEVEGSLLSSAVGVLIRPERRSGLQQERHRAWAARGAGAAS